MVALLLASAPAITDPLGVVTAVRGQCASDNPTEIVVCGSRTPDRRYRLPVLPEKYERASFRAETELAPGLHASAHVSSVELPGGVKSDRVMLTIGTAF